MGYGELNPDGNYSVKGLWHFNGDANDSSGNANHGTVEGDVTLVNTGRFGQCYDFEGTSGSGIDLGQPASLAITGVMSVLFWANFDVINPGGWGAYPIGHAERDGALYNFGVSIGCAIDNGGPGDGRLTFWWKDTVVANSLTTLSTGIWYSIGAVRSGSTGNWTGTLYLNGVPNGSGTTAVNPGSDAASYCALGRLGKCTAYSFIGRLDEVAIYNRALSPAEIRQLYAMQRGAYGVLEA